MLPNKIFLAGPYKQFINNSGVLINSHINDIKSLIHCLEDMNYHVDNAHRREQWGKAMMTPDVCTKKDFQSIQACNFFIAFPGFPASPGTHIEIGWASALDKEIILLLKKDVEYAYLIQGLLTVSRVKYIYYETISDCQAQLQDYLHTLDYVLR